MQSRPRKITFRIKKENYDVSGQNEVSGCGSTTPGHQDDRIEEQTDVSGSTLHGRQDSNLQRTAEITSSNEEKDYGSDEDDHDSCNAQNQLVVYDPAAAGSEIEAVPGEPDPIGYLPPPFSRYSMHNQTSRVLPSVGAFTVQCAICFKWRLIPSKEKYEEIREHILQNPFVCEAAREWRPEISCDDEPDIKQDGSRLWAIDRPNIAQPPFGWERLLRIRAEGGTKFADVYYVAPSGKRLRSMIEIQRYLVEHPDEAEGVDMSQFSFQIPRPLQENYVKKRPPRSALLDGSAMGMTGDSEPSQVAAAEPLAWAGPEANTDLRLGGLEYSAMSRPAKKSKKKTREIFNGSYMDDYHRDEGGRV